MLRFDGQVVIVTGAGRGIGREHALELARRGATVVVNDLGGAVDGSGASMQPAHGVVDEIVKLGAQAMASGSDVGSPDGAEQLVGDAIKAYERVDAIIHNAGVTGSDWQRTIEVSLSGGFWLAKAAWPHFLRQAYGRLLLTTSSAGLFGTRPARPEPLDYYAYGAAKMGLVGLARNLAHEGAAGGIKVNAIAPVAWSRLVESNLQDPRARQWMQDNFSARQIVPAAVLLVHRDCPGSGETYTVGGGRVARIAIGEPPGYCDSALTPESLLDHFEAVCDTQNLSFPRNIAEELTLFTQAFKQERTP